MKQNLLFMAIFTTMIIATGVTTSAYALRFDTDTGEGFISKGELMKAFGLTNQQLEDIVDNGDIDTVYVNAYVEFIVGCTPPEPDIQAQGGWQEILNFELVQNNQGHFIGIELTGYVDGPNPIGNEHPGDFCNTGHTGEYEYTLIDVTELVVQVNSMGEQIFEV